ncbi:alpha/beta fold hydrolase [Antarctobacter sp.]|uniref:alpha/beta fold hydrolase n=1 Tax=Antarctobacter sp. TaxID=1872577 RepID=UPI003A913A81
MIGTFLIASLLGGGVFVQWRAGIREAAALDRWPAVGAFVEVDGVPIHYVQRGSGPDVVLLHGASGNLRDFTFDLVDKLAQDYRVTVFDRPGLGYSGRREMYRGAFNTKAETPQDQAALLAAAAAQLGVHRPVVVGHSFGGAVAMAWGLDHDAAALVTLGGAIMPWPGDLDFQYRLLGHAFGGALVAPLVTAFLDPMGTRDAVAGIFAPQDMPDGYLAHVGPGLSLQRPVIRANGRQVYHLRPALTDMSARYPTLDLPVELLHGTADKTVGFDIHAVAAAKLLPDVQLTALPDVGHMPQHARPGAVIEAIHRAATRAGLR